MLASLLFAAALAAVQCQAAAVPRGFCKTWTLDPASLEACTASTEIETTHDRGGEHRRQKTLGSKSRCNVHIYTCAEWISPTPSTAATTTQPPRTSHSAAATYTKPPQPRFTFNIAAINVQGKMAPHYEGRRVRHSPDEPTRQNRLSVPYAPEYFGDAFDNVPTGSYTTFYLDDQGHLVTSDGLCRVYGDETGAAGYWARLVVAGTEFVEGERSRRLGLRPLFCGFFDEGVENGLDCVYVSEVDGSEYSLPMLMDDDFEGEVVLGRQERKEQYRLSAVASLQALPPLP